MLGVGPNTIVRDHGGFDVYCIIAGFFNAIVVYMFHLGEDKAGI